MRFFFLLVFSLPSLGWSQIDSVNIQNIPSVEIVKEIKLERTSTRTVEREDIERLAPIDLGDLLQKLPGATVRSYGSIGALKTISFNGLGAQHSAIVLDGFLVNNMLAGQVNLSQIQVDGIHSVYLTDEKIQSRLLPVKSKLNGNTLMIYSGLFYRSLSNTNDVRLSTGMSSFNTYEASGRYRRSGARSFVSVFGYYRESKGNFPFEFENGESTEVNIRKNNDFKELTGVLASGRDFTERLRGKIKLSGKRITQGLPGAVILYNDSRDERLSMDEFEINADLTYFKSPHFIRMYYAGLMRNTVYNDPTYLNADGFLRNQYIEQDHTIGITSFHVLKKMELESGISAESQFLTTIGVDFNSPLRMTGAGFVKLEHFIGNWKGNYQIGALAVDQFHSNQRKNYVKVMPRFKFYKTGTNRIHAFELSNSYRLPSFNELFFGSIGNPDLDPENAYQFKYAFVQNLQKGAIKSAFELNANSSVVDNKIVSVPTKNMFVWSIQNIEKTLAAGVVFTNSTTVDLRNVILTVDVNYQYQRVLDISDASEPTYLDQVAYVPLHTGSADLGVKYGRYQVNLSNYLVGYRYVLNENIDSNLEDGYLISDVSLRVKLFEKEKHLLTVQGVVKNIFDVQYAFIRGFVMPGRNYLIKLSYVLK